ncbi:MAG TPA: 2-phosphosulfolactate phosphatase [Firmicutes bacterium]|nr:2-phosphosulfolactate phosphatase [Candidatus Fermentithermobacillaceae bacterium]
MPEVTVLPTPKDLEGFDLSGSTAVVIDVLRATSSMAQALSSGCERIIPAKSEEEALALKKNFPEALLCGERRGRKISGFDLGNSPAEYVSSSVKGKVLIMTTSNGTRTIAAAREKGAVEIFMCSFLNLGKTAAVLSQRLLAAERQVSSRKPSLAVICSGSHGEFSLEDFACAGALIERMTGQEGLIKPELTLTESAVEAVSLYRRYNGDIMRILDDSQHGRYLRSIGFGHDLLFCSKVDSLKIVPCLSEAGIVAFQ